MSIRTLAPGKRRRTPHVRSALVPAASRTPTPMTAQELDWSGDAIEAFTAAVGGRRQLLATLAIADSAAAADKVVNLLLDPAYATWSLRRLCAYAGLTVADLFASYKKALIVKAHIEATHIITARLPPIVEDVMVRATPALIPCPRCDGTPTTPDTSDCPQCRGKGQVLSEPDLDRQKLALELGRLTEKKGPMVIQQNTAVATALTASGPGSLEQLQQAVGDLLFSPTRRRAQAPPPMVEDPIDGTSPSPRREPPVPDEPRADPEPAEMPEEDDEDDEAEDDDDRLTT